MPHDRLIDRLDPVRPRHPDGPLVDQVVATFLGRYRRLPRFARNHSFHSASPLAPGSTVLSRHLRWLQGKFMVVNPALDLALPRHVATVVRVVAHYCGAGGADGAAESELLAEQPAVAAALLPVARGADWFAVAIHEPVRVAIRRRAGAEMSIGGDGEDDFAADVPYRVVVYFGHGQPPSADTIGSSGAVLARGETTRLFTLRIYTPDDEALQQMDFETALHYKRITGRLGSDSRDRYWHLETLERYREGGRVIGCLAPALLDSGRARNEGWQSRPSATLSYEDFLFGPTGSYEASRWQELTPAFDRGHFVPPGYCLVEYAGLLSLSVVQVP